MVATKVGLAKIGTRFSELHGKPKVKWDHVPNCQSQSHVYDHFYFVVQPVDSVERPTYPTLPLHTYIQARWYFTN